MSQEKEDEKVGLELLDDATLVQIVEGDVGENQELKSPAAYAAFAELARRSGKEGW